jgi:hypothetical protein
MARPARSCPTRSVPACLRSRDWHAHRTLDPRPFGHYRRDLDRSSAPIASSERPVHSPSAGNPNGFEVGDPFGTLGVRRPFAVRLPELRAPIGLHDSEGFRYCLAICRLN